LSGKKSLRADFQGEGQQFSWFVASRRQATADISARFSDGAALPRRRYANRSGFLPWSGLVVLDGGRETATSMRFNRLAFRHNHG
jgi:hypothetical protein